MLILSDAEIQVLDKLREDFAKMQQTVNLNFGPQIGALNRILDDKQFTVHARSQGNVRVMVTTNSPTMADALYAGLKQTQPTCDITYIDAGVW